jgi:uncharacterized protein Usg
MITREMELMLAGHGLTTAQIFYRMPDFKTMLQSYLWQEYDTAPDFPKLHGFLEFWQENLDGPIHSVQFTHQKLIRPGEWQRVDWEFRLH